MLSKINTEEIDINRVDILPVFKSELYSDIENNLLTRLIIPNSIEQDWIKQTVKFSLVEPRFKDSSNESFISVIYKIGQSKNMSLKLIYMRKKYDNDNAYFVKSYPIYHYLNGRFISHNLKLENEVKVHELVLEFKNLKPTYQGE